MGHRAPGSPGRLFRLIRDQDPSGVAGTGHVASGVEWSDGSVTLKWHTPDGMTDPANVSHYANVTKALGIHGHGGRTRMKYVKNEPPTSVRLLATISDFTYYLGNFVEKAEKGLSPSADDVRRMFGRLLDIANEAKPAT